MLIDAAAMLQADRRLRVLIVGDGPEKPNLQDQVAERGLQDIVRFRSDVAEHTEVFALMKAARVFVFPSLREGFGIAPLEALACGTAVVTTSHPDNQARHLVARSRRGYVCEPNAEALAAAIAQALADPQDGRARRDLDRGVRLECGRRPVRGCSRKRRSCEFVRRESCRSRESSLELLGSVTSIGPGGLMTRPRHRQRLVV